MGDELTKLSYWVSILKQETECSICLHTLKDPVMTGCFHNFCKACISRVLRSEKCGVCPLCKTPINRRGAEVNYKIKVLIDKINPIIDEIKNGTSVDILSYYKGKSTTLFGCDTSKINFTPEDESRNNADINLEDQEGGNSNHELKLVKTQDKRLKITDTVSGKEDSPLIGATFIHGKKPKSFHDINIHSNEVKQTSTHSNEHFNELELLSVSQNICHNSNLRKSVKIPFPENVKSPAKKVKEWLSENDVEGCSSQDLSVSDPRSTCATTKNVIGLYKNIEDYDFNKTKCKQEEVGVVQNEFDIVKSFVSRKVYKGLRTGEDEWKKHGTCRNSRNCWRENEDDVNEEKDGIQDSCPVEMNDTFDRLVCEARTTELTKPISPPEKDFEDQSGIGLFESLPLSTENDQCKRKRHSNILKLEVNNVPMTSIKFASCEKSYNMHKKRKCIHVNEGKMNAKILGDINASTRINETNMQLGLDNNEIDKQVTDSLSKGNIESVQYEGNNVPANEKSSSKIASKFNSYEIDNLNRRAVKSERKRFDLCLRSPGWSRLNSTRKDFQDLKKGTLSVLDVSGGDPCHTLANRSHLSKNVNVPYEILKIKPLSFPVHVDDAESNQTQSVALKDLVSLQKNTATDHLNTSAACYSSKLIESTSRHDFNKSEGNEFFCESYNDSRKMSSPKAGSKTEINNFVVSKNLDKTEMTKKDKLEEDNLVESCDSTKNMKSQSLTTHCTKTPSGKKKIESKFSTPIVVERKMFSLNSSTPDLDELDDAIKRESTKEDQCDALTESSFQKKRNKQPSSEDFVKKTSFVENQEKKHFATEETGLDSQRRAHMKCKDKEYYTSVSRANQLSLKRPAGCSKNPSMKPKLVVPILKLGRLSEKIQPMRPRVKFYILGKLRQHDGAVTLPSEVNVAADSLTPLKEGRLSESLALCSMNVKDVGVQTKLILLNDLQTLQMDCQMSDDHESLEDSSSDRDDIVRCTSQQKSISSKDGNDSNKHTAEMGSTGEESFLRTPEIRSSVDSQNAIECENSDDKLEQILANIEADLNVRRKRKIISADELVIDEDNKMGEQSCKILKLNSVSHSLPETLASTPLYVEESDLSESESCDNIDVGSKETCVNENSVGDFLASGEESDCIVEASQRVGVTLHTRCVSKKGPISLVASGLTGHEVAHVKHVAQVFNLYFSPQFCGTVNQMGNPCTTHVVTKEDSDGKTFCTFKYLCGVIAGCWIVSINWIFDCLAAGRLIEEEPYEVSDACGSSGPSRGRHATKKLFAGFEFIYNEPFNDLTGEQIKEIIQLGGGKVVYDVEEFACSKGKRLAIADTSSEDSNADFNKFMKFHDIAVVSCEWLIECIEEYRILSLLNYVLNIDAESNLEQIHEKLLKMGYTEDLVKIDDEPIENTQM